MRLLFSENRRDSVAAGSHEDDQFAASGDGVLDPTSRSNSPGAHVVAPAATSNGTCVNV